VGGFAQGVHVDEDSITHFEGWTRSSSQVGVLLDLVLLPLGRFTNIVQGISDLPQMLQ
jgi:hypothetical protein